MKTLVDVLHYGGAGICVLLGLLSAAGVHLPGVEVNPAVAIPAVATGEAIMAVAMEEVTMAATTTGTAVITVGVITAAPIGGVGAGPGTIPITIRTILLITRLTRITHPRRRLRPRSIWNGLSLPRRMSLRPPRRHPPVSGISA